MVKKLTKEEFSEMRRKVQTELWKNPEYKEKMKKSHKRKYAEGKGKFFEKGHKIWLGKNHTEKSKKKMRLKSPLLGKSYEEVFGKEKAKEIIKKQNTKERAKKISLSLTGEKNPFWQGGISFEPYTKEFNNKFKRAIRKRDNQICMLCGIHREKLKKVLMVHHINYNKEMSIPQNCLSLCNSCHSKTNYNRKYWISFFQSLLSEKYRYEYSENQEIIIKPIILNKILRNS